MSNPSDLDPTSLYRFFDKSGRLLYVGITRRGWKRFDEHASSKPWWHLVATTTVAHYDTRAQARNAELVAIKSESPAFNIADKPNLKPKAVKRKWHVEIPASDGYPCTIPDVRDYRNMMPCRVTTLRGHARDIHMWLTYEVNLDPISDDWLVDEISPYQLFDKWYQQVQREYGRDCMVPIYWYVNGDGFKIENAIDDGRMWFGTYYQPIVSEHHSLFVPIECLPVEDKHWCDVEASKGGFIQEATHWRPQPLQREVSLQELATRARFVASRWDAR